MQDKRINPFITAFLEGGNTQQATLEFGGFGVTSGRDQLQHSVPGVDGHIEVMKGPFSLILENLSATRTFALQDVTFNGVGAFIRAAHAEIDFTTHIHDSSVLFGFAYSLGKRFRLIYQKIVISL